MKCFFGLFILFPGLVNGQNLDKILEAHFEAQGQENLMAMRSIFMKVREMDGFTEGKVYQITKKAPSKIRIEGIYNEQTFVNAFDGKTAWTIAPWTGVQVAQLMTERERDLFLMNAGIGSPLYDHGLGHVLEIIGSERADDANHYVIRSTMPSGFFVDYLVDKKDHLIHLARIYEEDEPEKVEREVIFKNYKNLGGVSIPFAFENRTGRSIYDIVVDDIVFGQGAPNSIFEKPE
ncbi:hypothetical protein SAMN04488029_2615 [Reichenbachiella faecimaris]|uniref:Outer membrane lipoprotein-sorting protein n=1 Tax=Reichenbachiella faecimaris TaxID=692418 RepID=A0A1W2GGZ0_REIFA|nr:hypothetical protein [Reichenbachiella faecimaris]SMD35933.1 hypothetical protein SAMN04488029_2615 [Reichenbachiella faecimaris]